MQGRNLPVSFLTLVRNDKKHRPTSNPNFAAAQVPFTLPPRRATSSSDAVRRTKEECREFTTFYSQGGYSLEQELAGRKRASRINLFQVMPKLYTHKVVMTSSSCFLSQTLIFRSVWTLFGSC